MPLIEKKKQNKIENVKLRIYLLRFVRLDSRLVLILLGSTLALKHLILSDNNIQLAYSFRHRKHYHLNTADTHIAKMR